MFRSKARSAKKAFQADMWALKNKATGKFITEGDIHCGLGGDLPQLFGSREVARQYKDASRSVVKVSVNVRAA